MVAGRREAVRRKVRAPQGRVLDNVQGGRPHGQRHRKQTAAALGVAARVKRCGKSAPAVRVTGPARQTPPGARPNRRASPREGAKGGPPGALGSGRSSGRGTGRPEEGPSWQRKLSGRTRL